MSAICALARLLTLSFNNIHYVK